MPAYFSVSFQYRKADIGDLSEIYNALLACGLKFKSGYYKADNDSWDSIVSWNQSKFDEDFELGYSEHYSHDYEQMLFDFCDFSQVRWFILNVRGEEMISFYLLVPEHDLFKYNELHDAIPQRDKMKRIEQFAVDMWRQSNACCVQTGWECSGESISVAEIINGVKPIIEPFAIVPRSMYRAEWDCAKKEIEGNGVFLFNNEHWYYKRIAGKG